MRKRRSLPPYAPEPAVTAEETSGPVLPPYYDGAVMAHGEGWAENPPYFLTAYGLAVRGGYGGTLEEWIASLKGETGLSAYDLARAAGYTGTEEALAEDLSSLPAYARTAAEAGAAAEAAAVRAEAAADGMVPQTRKLCGYDLSRDRDLAAADVGLGNVANERQYSAANPPKKRGSVALSAGWTGNESPYAQTVTVTGAAVTAASKIDLQPTAAQLAALTEDGVTGLVIGNAGGALTAYALGAAPSAAMTIQCTVEEVA
jgi:hypothetical protein